MKRAGQILVYPYNHSGNYSTSTYVHILSIEKVTYVREVIFIRKLLHCGGVGCETVRYKPQTTHCLEVGNAPSNGIIAELAARQRGESAGCGEPTGTREQSHLVLTDLREPQTNKRCRLV